jgi:TRAP-type mannitol/chloroaromatic compound transport system permease small subunit
VLPIPGTLEIVSYYYMVAIVVLPAAFVEMTRQSIAVDLFYQLMPNWMQVVCVAAVLLFSFVAYGMLAWITWPDAFRSFRMNELVMGPVDVVIWPARFLLPLTMTVTALVCLWHLLRFFTDSNARTSLVRVEMPGVDMEAD